MKRYFQNVNHVPKYFSFKVSMNLEFCSSKILSQHENFKFANINKWQKSYVCFWYTLSWFSWRKGTVKIRFTTGIQGSQYMFSVKWKEYAFFQCICVTDIGQQMSQGHFTLKPLVFEKVFNFEDIYYRTHRPFKYRCLS